MPTLPIPEIVPGMSIDDLRIQKILGVGAYGQVYRGYQPDTNRHYAIKSLSQHNLDKRELEFQRTEIRLHAALKHPNIIRLERVIRDKDWTHVVLEYGPQGDLFSAITEKNLYYGRHNLIRKVFLQLIDAVSFCHAKGVYHRDLKPENVLVFDSGHTAKLADFGLATTKEISRDYGCGSTFYYSPECHGADLAGKQVGYATAPNDVWSLGVILINLAAGRNPWTEAVLSDESFSQFLRDRNHLFKILPISRALNQILRCIFCIDPARRIGLAELRRRIERCKFFTRTPEVEKYEAAELDRRPDGLSVLTQQPLPPSPPDTPRSTSHTPHPFVAKNNNTSHTMSPKRVTPPPSPRTLPKTDSQATIQCSDADRFCLPKSGRDPDPLDLKMRPLAV